MAFSSFSHNKAGKKTTTPNNGHSNDPKHGSSTASAPTDDPPPYSSLSSSASVSSTNNDTKSSFIYSLTPPSTTSLAGEGSSSSSIPSPSPSPSLSSTTSSNSTITHKPRNVPYRPSEEQQKQIDLLTSKGPARIPNLRTFSSNTQTEYFDVLPSFQMFQSILRRDDDQFNENLSIQPPEYGDTDHSSPTPPHLSPRNSNTNIDGVLGVVNERLNEYELNDEHDDEEEEEYLFEEGDENDMARQNNHERHQVRNGSRSQSRHQSRHHSRSQHRSPTPAGHGEGGGEDGHVAPALPPHHHTNITYDNHGHSPLDNIDKLPKLNNSPIDIQIFVTKRVPEPNTNNELETRLKEYTSGDVVNGYIIITNKSDKPVNFGLFTVSLEGTVKEAERNLNLSSIDSNRFNKILMKKFLKMYDLNASYGYTHIPSSAGIEYEQYTIDTSDGCQFGLPNERILQPFKKYKKFFTFKFPEKLLDNSCMHTLIPHILPPPSMGFDRTSFYNKGDTIQLNKALGYGFLNIKGTPLITKDYSFEDVSVSYTIEAKFIDKLNAKDNQPLSQDEINDPESDANKYVISRSSQYFLRFIPDLREQFQYYNLGFQYSPDSFAKSGIDGKLFLDYMHLTTWRNINLQNYQVEQEIDFRLSKEELTEEDIKHKNLILDNSDLTRKRSQKISKKHQAYQELQRVDHHKEQQQQEQKFYEEQHMIGTKIPAQVYGKKKKMILSSLVKIGESNLYVKVPHKILPYASPRLLQKYNGTLEEDSGSNHISPSISNSLEPVSSTSSHMSELYNRDENDNINSIDISVIFNAVNDPTVKPPQISYVEVNLVYWSYYTEYPLPFELSYDFFYTNPEEDDKKHNDYVEITRKNLQGLKDQVGNYIQFLKSNKTFVSKNSFLYLKSIKSLGIKKDTIKEYYKTITPQTHPDVLGSQDSWRKTDHTKFVKDLHIPLIPINKNNVTLLPSFQNCLVGRLYCLQIVVKYKGNGGNEQNEFADNIVKVDIPVLVG